MTHLILASRSAWDQADLVWSLFVTPPDSVYLFCLKPGLAYLGPYFYYGDEYKSFFLAMGMKLQQLHISELQWPALSRSAGSFLWQCTHLQLGLIMEAHGNRINISAHARILIPTNRLTPRQITIGLSRPCISIRHHVFWSIAWPDLLLVLCLPRQTRSSCVAFRHIAQLSSATCCNHLCLSSRETECKQVLYSKIELTCRRFV